MSARPAIAISAVLVAVVFPIVKHGHHIDNRVVRQVVPLSQIRPMTDTYAYSSHGQRLCKQPAKYVRGSYWLHGTRHVACVPRRYFQPAVNPTPPGVVAGTYGTISVEVAP